MDTHQDQHHPSPSVYVKVALALAVVTGIEIAVSYMGWAAWVEITALIVLSIIKFVAVVGWFMHLKFDNPALRKPFITGIVLALAIYSVVLFQMLLHSNASSG